MFPENPLRRADLLGHIRHMIDQAREHRSHR